MNYREPNDAGGDADKHNDKLAVDVDAEWLQQQQPAAIDAAYEAGMFDHLEGCAAAIDMQPNTIRTGSEMLQVLFADMDRVLGSRGDGKNKDAEKAGACAGYFETQARGGR